MNLKSYQDAVASIMDADFDLLRSNRPHPETESLYANFQVRSVALARAGEPIHGRTGAEKALQEADEMTIVLVRRQTPDAGDGPSSQQQTASRGEPDKELAQVVEAYWTASQRGEFVAIKWFRDSWLPQQGYSWAKDAEKVRALLRAAIDQGLLRTEQRPNPNNPDHPTTTLREGNPGARRAAGSPAAAGVRRFSPISIPGKPLSATVLDGR